jgi:DNA processing protein
VLDELQLAAIDNGVPAAPPATPESQPEPASLAATGSALLQALGHDPVGLDELQARTGLPTPELLAQLMTLELQGQVARMTGGRFQRMAQA